MSEDRVTELEVKVAFQEHTIEQLDKVIQTMMKKIDMLERRINEVVAEQQSSQAPLDNPPPPHW